MKDLTRSLLAFVLIYGTRDKARFQKHALSLMDPYPIEEDQKAQIIEFAYDFFHSLGERLNQVDVISRGVHAGVGDLDAKLSAILEKLESIKSKSDQAESTSEAT